MKTLRANGKFEEKDVNKVIQGLAKSLNLPKVSSSDEAKDFFSHINNDKGDFDKCKKLTEVCEDKSRINAIEAFKLFNEMFFTKPKKFNTKIWSRTHIDKKFKPTNSETDNQSE